MTIQLSRTFHISLPLSGVCFPFLSLDLLIEHTRHSSENPKKLAGHTRPFAAVDHLSGYMLRELR